MKTAHGVHWVDVHHVGCGLELVLGVVNVDGGSLLEVDSLGTTMILSVEI